MKLTTISENSNYPVSKRFSTSAFLIQDIYRIVNRYTAISFRRTGAMS